MFSALPIAFGFFCATVLRRIICFFRWKKGGKGELNVVGPFGTESISSLDIIWEENDPILVATVSCV
jgi:hypothetical protein